MARQLIDDADVDDRITVEKAISSIARCVYAAEK